jgi:cytochrome c-type biogenesis protein
MPGFLAYLAGSTPSSGKTHKGHTFLISIFFVLGFTLVFAALGLLLNTLLEAIAYDVLIWLGRLGGLIIIFFGLYLMGLLRIPFLEREHKIPVKQTHSRYLTAFLFGSAFAAGWTPCVGAVLGSILGLAATQPGTAFFLLIAYSLGFGIPFLILGLFASQAGSIIGRFAPFFSYLRVAFGIVLIVMGILIFTQSLSRFANFETLIRILGQ